MESGWIDKQPPTVSITISVAVSFLVAMPTAVSYAVLKVAHQVS